MKVLILNGSPRINGNISVAVNELVKTFAAEGLQTIRNLAKNMSFLMKSIALGKAQYGLPEKEPWQPTHFIRSDLTD